MSVLGKGSVRFEVERITQFVSDVHFVPNLTNNLLSIVQLQEKTLGYHNKRKYLQNLTSSRKENCKYCR